MSVASIWAWVLVGLKHWKTTALGVAVLVLVFSGLMMSSVARLQLLTAHFQAVAALLGALGSTAGQIVMVGGGIGLLLARAKSGTLLAPQAPPPFYGQGGFGGMNIDPPGRGLNATEQPYDPLEH